VRNARFIRLETECPRRSKLAGWPWGCDAGRKGASAWFPLLGLLRVSLGYMISQ